MPGYALFCTTCKKSAESRAAWISHLLHEGHQKAARSEIGRWGKAERKTALVVYANFPVSADSASGGLSLLEHFSSAADLPTIVTDFVTIPELPQVAVVQFECKTRAREILEKAGGTNKVSINAQLVQLRKAEDYLDLEWQALLSKLNSDSAGGDGGEAGSKIGKRKQSKLIYQEEDSNVDEQDQDNQKRRKQISVSNLQVVAEEGPAKPPAPTTTPSSNLLRTQFEQLCRSVEIPNEEFNAAIQLLQKLEELAAHRMPACKLYMFRTWHLKLRTLGGRNELLLFIDTTGRLSGEEESREVRTNNQIFDAVFSTTTAQREVVKLGLTFSRRRRADLNHVPEFVCCHQISGTSFTIRPEVHPWFIVEVQACRLLEYLCTFDIRVKPLYTLIFYWTAVNNVHLSNPVPVSREVEFSFSPEPAAMEWLIMCFLCHEKLVPTPRQVSERESPGKIAVLKSGIDIGFSVDAKFADSQRKSNNSDSLPPEDSDEFLINVLSLVNGFFTFCSRLSSGCWILNTRDGEVLKTKDFVEEGPGFVSRLTISEREMIKGLSGSTFLDKVLWEGDSIILLHPLLLKQRFAFGYKMFIRDVIPVMNSTANKLQRFLQAESYRDEVLTSGANKLKYLFHEK